ncbi:MAG: VWA domain-containing protein [Roseibium sp.]
MNIDPVFANLSAFHFIRPLWLLALLAVALIWWLIRRAANRGTDLPAAIAPHLSEALTVGKSDTRRIRPIDMVAIMFSLLVLGASGPTWSRVPNPLVSDTAPLVVVLKVTKSMMQSDIPPSRLERAKHKVQDLLNERSGAKTALLAYAGTVHQVVPPTEDPDVIKPFLEGLTPAVMPQDGESARTALRLANDVLTAQETPGAILYLLDRITDADPAAFVEHAKNGGAPVLFWFVGRENGDRAKLAALPGSTVIDITADTSDVAIVLRNIEAVYQAALSKDDRQKWKDEGWIFAWPAAILLLFWFRRGWTMQWAVILLAVGLTLPAPQAKADSWLDWFLTPDQQGRLAFEDKEYQQAADLFQNPMWKAYSLYRQGKYEESAEIYAWQDSSEAAMGEGMSLIKSRSYRPAIAAFEKAVERDPDNAAAQHNLELARHILDYVETAREQSDTGEEGGIGADEVVYDNEASRGADSQVPSEQASDDKAPQTAEHWMRTVDSRTGDFLKSRFALEAARGPK